MESHISASRYNLAKRYAGFLHFLLKYHPSVYMKQAIYRLTDKSFWKDDLSDSRYIA